MSDALPVKAKKMVEVVGALLRTASPAAVAEGLDTHDWSAEEAIGILAEIARDSDALNKDRMAAIKLLSEASIKGLQETGEAPTQVRLRETRRLDDGTVQSVEARTVQVIRENASRTLEVLESGLLTNEVIDVPVEEKPRGKQRSKRNDPVPDRCGDRPAKTVPNDPGDHRGSQPVSPVPSTGVQAASDNPGGTHEAANGGAGAGAAADRPGGSVAGLGSPAPGDRSDPPADGGTPESNPDDAGAGDESSTKSGADYSDTIQDITETFGARIPTRQDRQGVRRTVGYS